MDAEQYEPNPNIDASTLFRLKQQGFLSEEEYMQIISGEQVDGD